MIMDRIHEAAAIATPMGVNEIDKDKQGGPGDDEPHEGDEGWWWSDDYECCI